MAEVVALGEVLIDFAQKSKDVEGYPTMAAHAGGAPANFLAALRNLGHSTAIIGKVGVDAFGVMLLGTLERCGIDVSGLVQDEDCFTTLAFVTFNREGDRAFSFARKPGADTQLRFEEIKLSLIDQAKAFHFGTLSLTDEPVRSATRAAVAYAKAKGKLITCDPNLRLPLWREIEDARREMLWAVSHADVVKISDEEVDFLWGCTPEEGAEKLLNVYGVSLAMVTLGPKGSYLKNRSGASAYCAGPQVSPIDTTGAGDIFGGTALACILESGKNAAELSAEELKNIGTFASTAASLSTERSGGIASIPSREDIQARVAKLSSN